MSITKQQHRDLTKPSIVHAFHSTKWHAQGEKSRKRAASLELHRRSEIRREFLWRPKREWSERLQLRHKLSRAIKGEVLHSQRNCLFPFAGSQPFIHWNICTSHRLQQGIHPLLKSQHLHGETNERTGGEGGQIARICSKDVHYLFTWHHWRIF